MRSLLLVAVVGLLGVVPALHADDDESRPVTADTPPAAALHHLAADLERRFGTSPRGVLLVDVSEQRLSLLRDGALVRSWPVSTSRFGVGSQENSHRTPLGAHRVAEKFGAGAPPGTLFRARSNTGRQVEILTDDRAADDDYVTTRILWLEGLEPGVNRGRGIDSYRRYIYIHGTVEEGRIGRPASHGCVRMRNADVIDVFDEVDVGTLVLIRE